MARQNEGRWLSLGRACQVLGVNETTLRHWANTGRIRAFRTPGGHRRFSRDDVSALLSGPPVAPARAAHTNGAHTGKGPSPSNGHSPDTLERMRRRIGRGRGRDDTWLQHFDDEGRSRMRVLGRRLVSLTTDYASNRRRRAELQEEARHLGIDYGRELAARGIGLREALSAFLYFRKFLHGAVDQGDDDAARIAGLLCAMEVEDVVLLGLAQVYDFATSSGNGGTAVHRASASQPAAHG